LVKEVEGLQAGRVKAQRSEEQTRQELETTQHDLDEALDAHERLNDQGKVWERDLTSEAKECADCLAPEGQHGVFLSACAPHNLTHYCGRACQTAHWKAGHRSFA
jgi:hypothetical protein